MQAALQGKARGKGEERRLRVGHKAATDIGRGVEAVDEDNAGLRALGGGQDAGADVLEALMGGGQQESSVEEQGAERRLLVGCRANDVS